MTKLRAQSTDYKSNKVLKSIDLNVFMKCSSAYPVKNHFYGSFFPFFFYDS